MTVQFLLGHYTGGQLEVADEQFGAAAATQNLDVEALLKRSAGLWLVVAAVVLLICIF